MQQPLRASCTELHHIHECLRDEIDRLQNLCIVYRKSLKHEALYQVVLQFRFFVIALKSHSQAEDKVILPAMVKKGLHYEMGEELECEHHKHEATLIKIENLLNNLTSKPHSFWRRPQLRSDVSELEFLVESVRSSVLLHFRKEEEEIFPILCANFSADDLNALESAILGHQSSESMNLYLQMISRNLSAEKNLEVIGRFIQIANRTHLVDYLDSVGALNSLDPEKKLLAIKDRPSLGKNQEPPENIDSTPSFHSCRNPGECCSHELEPGARTPFGCNHYKRNCKLYFPCCKKLYCCRFCHDEDNSSFSSSGSLLTNLEWHKANRYEVKYMWCQSCRALQPIGRKCIACGLQMARYVCQTCNLLDDSDNRPIYHCQYCNVCRVALGLGKDMFHCMKCNVCINTKILDHVCVEDASDADCAICLDKLFTGSEPMQRLLCGHAMHQSCYGRFASTHYRCPLCRKSACDMSSVWKMYDEVTSHLLSQADVHVSRYPIHVNCFDCDYKFETLRVATFPECLPTKCLHCGSYNTSV